MSTPASPSGGLPAGGPFFQTAEQRAALARQRFFEESGRPTGLVSEAVIQSWSRCRTLGHRPQQRAAVDPVSASALAAVRQRNRDLMLAAGDDLSQLEASLAGTGCRVLLTNATGVVVHATDMPFAAHQQVLDVAGRTGVRLSEDRVGTTAPGIVVRTGQACCVSAGEHYYEVFRGVHCAAAPIFDMHRRLAGVLDVSTEGQPFGFDAASVVGVFATSIENRLLQAQSREHAVLQFQTTPALLDTPLQGLAGLDGEGRVVWINAAGRRLLGRHPAGHAAFDADAVAPEPAEAVFGTALGALLDLGLKSAPGMLRLPNGLGIWLRARVQWRDGLDVRHTVAVPIAAAPAAAPVSEPAGPEPDSVAPSVTSLASTASLADANRQLIESTLARNGGNVARTARELGVSRGLLYRHLRRPAADKTPGDTTD